VTATIFIDGREGTTGLQLHERVANRPDLRVIEVPSEMRKDPDARREAMANADVTILCLPDDAARDAVRLAAGLRTRLLDASVAHRTAPDWVYGMPELVATQRDAIRGAARVANPGCHATGFLLPVRPLVDAGIVPTDYPIIAHALSGYSGGGKRLIEAFARHDHSGPSPDWSVRSYALSLQHKHVPEMQRYALLSARPVLCPVVAAHYQGEIVGVPLLVRLLARPVTVEDVHAVLAARYAGEPFVTVLPLGGGDAVEDGYLSPTACNGTNRIELLVTGNSEQILVSARLDNLGKGASGQALQNLNLMLGVDERLGLTDVLAAPANVTQPRSAIRA
jgi:N-acetyl-gamma-glutamyl-phosphate reductase